MISGGESSVEIRKHQALNTSTTRRRKFNRCLSSLLRQGWRPVHAEHRHEIAREPPSSDKLAAHGSIEQYVTKVAPKSEIERPHPCKYSHREQGVAITIGIITITIPNIS